MAYLLAAVVGLAFGAADQYLGSISSLGAWAVTLSQVSAPWLLLAFLVGMTQERVRRAMALGLAATLPALVGYFAMTCSPMENVAIERFSSCFNTVTTVPYNPLWIAGGILFAPLYGFLGQRWRVERSRVSAVVVTGTLCLEPLSRLVVGRWMLSSAPIVWCVEVAIGALLAAFFAHSISISHRRRGRFIPQDEL